MRYVKVHPLWIHCVMYLIVAAMLFWLFKTHEDDVNSLVEADPCGQRPISTQCIHQFNDIIQVLDRDTACKFINLSEKYYCEPVPRQ